MLLVSQQQNLTLTLPHPAEVLGWLSLVALDTSYAIRITLPEETTILNDSNLHFNFAGDALTLLSNRVDTWMIVGVHRSHFYY